MGQLALQHLKIYKAFISNDIKTFCVCFFGFHSSENEKGLESRNILKDEEDLDSEAVNVGNPVPHDCTRSDSCPKNNVKDPTGKKRAINK